MKYALATLRYIVTGIVAMLLVLVIFALESCTVGPKYVRPSAPTPETFKEQPPASYEQAGQWQPANPGDQASRGKWWEIFGDPELNKLEEQVATSNQDLKVFEARFREARAAIRFYRASQFPTISTSPSASYVKATDYPSNFPSKVPQVSQGEFVLPFDLSYELDLWGRVRRSVAAAREEAQATAADYETAKLSSEAELAMDYFELRSADAQKQLLDDTVKAYSDNVQLTTHRFKGGAAPRSDVAQAQTQLDTTRVQDTDVTVQRAQFEHAIAILIGKPPAKLSIAATPLNYRPPVIPVGLPSDLLQRRPDIAAAERRVAEANQQIGIAKAAYFPTITLNGTAGFAGTQGSNWFTWPAGFWAVGPVVAETLFDAGRRRATSESARANYDATVATYRQTSLTAFQEVEDNLAALRILENEAQQQDQAVASSKDSLHLFTNRYKGGVDTYLQVITAETTELA
ncbi:MAG TPA: efflux transporter outer membrane subunit, partial [Terriglobales bacterium]